MIRFYAIVSSSRASLVDEISRQATGYASTIAAGKACQYVKND